MQVALAAGGVNEPAEIAAISGSNVLVLDRTWVQAALAL